MGAGALSQPALVTQRTVGRVGSPPAAGVHSTGASLPPWIWVLVNSLYSLWETRNGYKSCVAEQESSI